MKNNSALLDTLNNSEMVRDYERAFTGATGLPLTLRAKEPWKPPFRGKAKENSFCALMAQRSGTCAACLRMQERMSNAAEGGTAVLKCHFDMLEVAVPVKLGSQTLGFLATGQVLAEPPTSRQLDKMERSLKKFGVDVDPKEARAAYKATRVMPRTQLVSTARLLEDFAEHLAVKSNQLAMKQANSEPAAVVRAKAYIRANMQEDITLTDVAKAACTSTFYICKLFKRHTGVNFTEYVSRIRIERAKELLANPNLRVSEIAFEIGFQSLTHFNRVFRKIVGQAPTAFREKVAV